MAWRCTRATCRIGKNGSWASTSRHALIIFSAVATAHVGLLHLSMQTHCNQHELLLLGVRSDFAVCAAHESEGLTAK